jgi:hypothetical protein
MTIPKYLVLSIFRSIFWTSPVHFLDQPGHDVWNRPGPFSGPDPVHFLDCICFPVTSVL